MENSVEILEILKDKPEPEDEGRNDFEAVTKRKFDSPQLGGRDEKESGSTSPVKRRRRNLENRQKAIEKVEEDMIDFVWYYLTANQAKKFPSNESLYDYSVQTVKHKILQPEVSSYSRVIEQGGSWTEFQLNRAMEENVQRFLEEIM